MDGDLTSDMLAAAFTTIRKNRRIDSSRRISLVERSVGKYCELVMKHMFKNIPVAKCLIWCAILLSPLQALQGMHVLCQHCVGCSSSPSNEAPVADHDACCCRKSVDLDTGSNSASGVSSFSPCPCESNCWCHRPTQPQLPNQESAEVGCASLIAPLASSIELVLEPACLSLRHPSETRPLSAQETCVTLCRFLA